MKKRTWAASLLAALAAAAVAAGALVVATPATAATATVTVNVGQSTGVGNLGIGRGFLYGLSTDGSAPSDALLRPLKPTSFRSGGEIDEPGSFGWALGEAQFNPRYAAASAQAKRVTRAPYDATFDLILSDLWGSDGSGIRPDPIEEPCDDGPACANWVAFLTELIERLGDDGLLNDDVRFDIWNEPAANSYFWPRSQEQYYQMWNKGVQTIRALYPDAIIVGPSIPNYHWPTLQNYLNQARTAGTMPDIWNWHFSGEPLADANEARSQLAAAGFPNMPIAMNEYLYSDQQFAGFAAWYLAQLQRARYESAVHAIWNNCCGSGLLDGLLVNTGSGVQTTGAYWVYKASADATGTVVQSAGAGGVDLLATRDDSARSVSVLLGSRGTFSGTLTAQLSGIPSSFLQNGRVRVVVQRLVEGALPEPLTISDTNATVNGGNLSVTVPWTSTTDAYSVRILPGTSSGGSVTTVDGNVKGTGQNQFAYTSGWGTTTGIADMFAGTANWASGSSDVATFAFTGTKVELRSVRDTDQGRYSVSIDGGAATVVDGYAATRNASGVTWTSPTLASGSHTLTLRPTGQKNPASSGFTLAIDRVDVTG
ncbi:hypothetical protein AB1046_00570 [Promicromonospora sp. Populi]|uniref:hypothetical protein n=1 Tax=Promicromonospora sp. Populi TaxID=3239420 RepID=UPI0034E2C29B